MLKYSYSSENRDVVVQAARAIGKRLGIKVLQIGSHSVWFFGTTATKHDNDYVIEQLENEIDKLNEVQPVVRVDIDILTDIF